MTADGEIPAKINGEHPIVPYARRIVSLEQEVRELRGAIREVYTQAKDAGCLKGAVRGVVKRLLEDEEQRLAREAIESERDQALASIGMLDGKPVHTAKQAEMDLGAGTAGNGVDQPAAEPPKRRRGRPRKDDGLGQSHTYE